MNKKNKLSPGNIIMGVGVMLGYAIVLIYSAYSTGDIFLPLICGLIITGVTAVCMGILLLREYFFPYMRNRRAAIKALGKDGFTVAIKDPVAKMACKGIARLFDEDYPKAEEYLEKALSMSDVRHNQYFCVEWLVRLYERSNNEVRYVWAIRKAAELAPDSCEAQSRLGHYYVSNGKLDKAEYCFEQAMHFNPNEGYPCYSMAKIAMLRGNTELAKEYLDRVIKINESHPLAYAEYAIISAMNEEYEKSHEYYQKALCLGYDKFEKLQRQLDAIKRYNNGECFNGEDLPEDYYIRREKDVKTEKE